MKMFEDGSVRTTSRLLIFCFNLSICSEGGAPPDGHGALEDVAGLLKLLPMCHGTAILVRFQQFCCGEDRSVLATRLHGRGFQAGSWQFQRPTG